MENKIPDWLTGLSEKDWRFIKRLILASGSLKDIANQYGITYPTVRIRLNRLIKKVQILDSGKSRTPFHQKVQLLAAEGRLDLTIAKMLIKEFEKNINQK